jgi:hypothetical protein
MGSVMPKCFVPLAAIALVAVASLAEMAPEPVGAAGFDTPASVVDLTDADICFGSSDPDFYSHPITCPGPAASIRFEPEVLLTAYCGSQSTLSVVVTDARGVAVATTLVSFMTDGGRVGETSETRGGLATTTFSVHAKTSGVARVVATVGILKAEREVHVGC